MMTAHVTDSCITLRYDSFGANRFFNCWDKLLDELKSRHIPGLYQEGKRSCIASVERGETSLMIYFTSETVTKDEAIIILKKWYIRVIVDANDHFTKESVLNDKSERVEAQTWRS